MPYRSFLSFKVIHIHQCLTLDAGFINYWFISRIQTIQVNAQPTLKPSDILLYLLQPTAGTMALSIILDGCGLVLLSISLALRLRGQSLFAKKADSLRTDRLVNQRLCR